ncbi:hypothetical protein BU17DRAFT_72102 [Hysterangium stoloniferum]|nr:hypothetical protein BU17DRAFT_72102 [Hysterangium stoloniferum]
MVKIRRRIGNPLSIIRFHTKVVSIETKAQIGHAACGAAVENRALDFFPRIALERLTFIISNGSEKISTTGSGLPNGSNADSKRGLSKYGTALPEKTPGISTLLTLNRSIRLTGTQEGFTASFAQSDGAKDEALINNGVENCWMVTLRERELVIVEFVRILFDVQYCILITPMQNYTWLLIVFNVFQHEIIKDSTVASRGSLIKGTFPEIGTWGFRVARFDLESKLVDMRLQDQLDVF